MIAFILIIILILMILIHESGSATVPAAVDWMVVNPALLTILLLKVNYY